MSPSQRSRASKMINLIRPSTVYLCFLLLCMACGTARTQTRTARVVAENAILRETPSSTGLGQGDVPEGVVVKILDEKVPWYVVRVGDRVGWMHGATLLLIDNASVPTQATQAGQPLTATTPTETPSPPDAPTPQPTRSIENKVYIRGPRGGCYYVSGSGRKVYVDRSMCN